MVNTAQKMLMISCMVIILNIYSQGIVFSQEGQNFPIAPKYSSVDLNTGEIVTLESIYSKNNLTVLNLWATWCQPCREEIPILEKIYQDLSPYGVDVIGVSIDRRGSESMIKSFSDRLNMTYPILYDPNNNFARAFKTIGVPESFLINSDGEIVYRWRGPIEGNATLIGNFIASHSPLVDEQIKRISLQQPVSLHNINNISGNSDTMVVPGSLSNEPTIGPNQQQQQQESGQPVLNYNIGIPLAFAAGLLSFLSPCVFPLIPSFLAFVTGTSLNDMSSFNVNKSVGEKEKSQLQQERENRRIIRSRLLVRTVLFILGFSVVFILLGVSTTTIGSLFYEYSTWIARIGGAILVVFGIHLTGLITIPVLERQLGFKSKNKPTSQIGSFAIGMSFGAGWTPCIGPILAGILTIAASSTSLWTGIQLLSFYALGLAVPFFISALVIERFITFFKRIRKWLPWINRISGIILITIGIILLTGQLALLTSYVPNMEPQLPL